MQFVKKDVTMAVIETTKIQTALDLISKATGVPVAELTGSNRSVPIVRTRDAAIWALRTTGHFSSIDLGCIFGGRDHSTILSALKRFERTGAQDSFVLEFVEELDRLFNAANP